MAMARLSIAIVASQLVLMGLLIKHGGTPTWLLALWGVLMVAAVTFLAIGRAAGSHESSR